MDEVVKPKAALRAVALLGMLCALCAAAGAQSLQDPTRPPAAAAPGHAAAQAAGEDGPRLQTILIGRAPGGRHLAVIDGTTVRPGDDFQGMRVASVRDNEVVLVRGRERKVLRLYDNAAGGMTPVASARPAAHAALADARLRAGKE
ncbi:hypothetical protein [uncultured Massilia sp.]|uniref:hypothetical protein n=1 Tax=uncultured Massilia sp. TaxID=169973 RepID=UPI0025FC3E41|nr:hypothetical protein [uncultured Massilia sp.]